MVDERFGTLSWDDSGEVWITSCPLPYFRGSGENLARGTEPANASASAAETAPAAPDLTRGQVQAQQMLAAELQSVPPEQRALFEAILAATQSGLAQPSTHPAPTAGAESEDPADADGAGEVSLEIDTGSRRRNPSPAQQLAWKRVEERGDAIWGELMEVVLNEYQQQRAVRVHWWQAVYGEYDLQRTLPEIMDVEGLRALVRPTLVRILPAGRKANTADLEVYLDCTWNSGALEILIRDGQVIRIGSGIMIDSPDRAAGKKLQHPVLGHLRRVDETAPWTGAFVCEPFREYLALIANQRAAFRYDPDSRLNPQSVMSWDFAYGRFELNVYAPSGENPSEEQAQAVAQFRSDEVRNVGKITASVFQYYQSVYEVARSEYMDKYPEDNVPPPTGPEILHDRLQLLEVNVFPPDEEGRVKLGFVFLCLWNPGPVPDLGVRWSDGRVEGVGARQIGRKWGDGT